MKRTFTPPEVVYSKRCRWPSEMSARLTLTWSSTTLKDSGGDSSISWLP